MNFILRAIFYTLLPRDKKLRLIVLGLALVGFITFMGFAKSASAFAPDLGTGNCPALPSDWQSQVTTANPGITDFTYATGVCYDEHSVQIYVGSPSNFYTDGGDNYFQAPAGPHHEVIFSGYNGDPMTYTQAMAYDGSDPWTDNSVGGVALATGATYQSGWLGSQFGSGGGSSQTGDNKLLPDETVGEISTGFISLLTANILPILGILAVVLGINFVRKMFNSHNKLGDWKDDQDYLRKSGRIDY